MGKQLGGGTCVWSVKKQNYVFPSCDFVPVDGVMYFPQNCWWERYVFMFLCFLKTSLWTWPYSLQKLCLCFLCSLYVGFVPVSNLLDMYCSIWQGVFSTKFLFVTDPNPKFGWRVFGGPRSPKTFHVMGDPKVIYKNIAMLLGLSKLGNAIGVV